jgi:hypothetical protein
MPSVTMDPSSGSPGAAPGQSPPATGLSSLVAIAAAPPKQTPPSASGTMLASALGAIPGPIPLKKRKLGVKKSALQVSECFHL